MPKGSCGGLGFAPLRLDHQPGATHRVGHTFGQPEPWLNEGQAASGSIEGLHMPMLIGLRSACPMPSRSRRGRPLRLRLRCPRRPVGGRRLLNLARQRTPRPGDGGRQGSRLGLRPPRQPGSLPMQWHGPRSPNESRLGRLRRRPGPPLAVAPQRPPKALI